MSTKDDGGPAFPTPYSDGDGQLQSFNGMTLRDYFAAKAIAQVISCSLNRDGSWDATGVALCCYEVADAMLEARKS